MEIHKENTKLKSVLISKTKPGDLFEYNDNLYMKSNESNELGITCIRMDSGTICYFNETAYGFKVELTRIGNGKLGYKTQYDN